MIFTNVIRKLRKVFWKTKVSTTNSVTISRWDEAFYLAVCKFDPIRIPLHEFPEELLDLVDQVRSLTRTLTWQGCRVLKKGMARDKKKFLKCYYKAFKLISAKNTMSYTGIPDIIADAMDQYRRQAAVEFFAARRRVSHLNLYDEHRIVDRLGIDN
jgi:hypothetical protein